MKKLALSTIGFALATLCLALFLAPTAHADSWTGWVSDSHCGAGGAKAGHASCAKKCVHDGGKFVFVNGADKKVYQLSKQDIADDLLAGEVTVTGTVEGDSIKVESIAKKAA